MARAHVMRPITSDTGDLLYGAQVLVRESGVSAPVAQVIYSSATGTGTLPNPFITASGVIDFWLDVPQRVNVLVTKSGHSDITAYLDAQPPPEEVARTDSPLSIVGQQLPGRVLLAGTTTGQASWSDAPTNSGLTPQVTVVSEPFSLASDPVGWTITQSAAHHDYATQVPPGQGYTYSLHAATTGDAASLVALTPGFTLGEPGWVSCWIKTNLAAGEQAVIAITNQVGTRTVLETITGVRDWGFYRYTVAAGTYQSLSVEYSGAGTFTGTTGHEMWVTGVRALYGGQVPLHTHSGAGSNSVQLGAGGSASAPNAVALGPTAAATGNNAVAVGYGSQGSGTDSIALGSGAQAPTASSIAIGAGAHGSLTAVTWTAIGPAAYVDSDTGTAIGASAAVYGTGGTAIGNTSYVGASNGVAIGYNARAQATGSVAIGNNALTGNAHSGSVAIGNNAATTAAAQVVLGQASLPNMNVLVANKLYAISAVQVGTDSTSRLGFFGSEGTNKPIVTGSAGGVAALQNLLGALAGLNLITNATS